MQFMMIVKATAESEAGVMPKPEQILEMQKYNEGLVKGFIPAPRERASTSTATRRRWWTARSPKRRSSSPDSG